jgi:hypothetical protein
MGQFSDVNVKSEVAASKKRILKHISDIQSKAQKSGVTLHISDLHESLKVLAGIYGAFVSSEVRKLDAKIKLEALSRLKSQGVDITMASARDFLMQAGTSSISFTTAHKHFATPKRAATEHKAVRIDASKYPNITGPMLEKLEQAKLAFKPVKKECREVFRQLLPGTIKDIKDKGFVEN